MKNSSYNVHPDVKLSKGQLFFIFFFIFHFFARLLTEKLIVLEYLARGQTRG